uniref:Protein kinase domain-containing protein n=1 Tax=Meloidogyne incognita TaxID=6306 RepID=A0A914NIJ6_MELIC
MRIPANEVIDGEIYTFVNLLGKGAFGTVYKCKNSKGQFVAIKRIMNDTAALEAKIMRQLNRPEFEQYFVQCHKIFQSVDGAICIVMEYCSGGSLEAFVKRVGKIDRNSASTFLAQLVKGVQKLHTIGLMHRDLKPANILIGRVGVQIRLKIADFGISKDIPDCSTFLTQCGTPCYMAPEVVEGQRYDKSADVFSLGAIMYFMTRGSHLSSFYFDRCGYPEYIDRPKGHSHSSISGRMMCKRKEERLKLDEIEIQNKNQFFLLKTRNCTICGRILSK